MDKALRAQLSSIVEATTWSLNTRTESVSKGTRKGARVRFTGLRAFYSHSPAVGEEGTVGTMPGFGSRTYLPGPGGGLLYVNWDESGMIGVSPNDLEKVGPSEGVARRVQAAKRRTTKRDITSKKGVTVAKDAKVTLSWKSPTGEERPSITRITDSAGNTVAVSTENLSKYVTGVGKAPSINTMEKWVSDGVGRSVLGARVENDGWDSDESPSWMLVLGLI